jgi:hypothetical protein
LLAVAWAIWRGRKEAWTLCLATSIGLFVLSLSLYLDYSSERIWHLDSYLVPAFFFEALLAGLGLAYAVQTLRGRSALVLAMVTILASAAWAALPWSNNQSASFGAYDDGRNTLDFAAKDSLLVLEGDQSVDPCLYLQAVEGRRPDLAVVPGVFLSFGWGSDLWGRRLSLEKIPEDLEPDEHFKAAAGQLVARLPSDRKLYTSLYHDGFSRCLPDLEGSWAPWGLDLEYRPRSHPSDPSLSSRLGLLQALRQRAVLEEARFRTPYGRVMGVHLAMAWFNAAKEVFLSSKDFSRTETFLNRADSFLAQQDKPLLHADWDRFLQSRGSPGIH